MLFIEDILEDILEDVLREPEAARETPSSYGQYKTSGNVSVRNVNTFAKDAGGGKNKAHPRAL